MEKIRLDLWRDKKIFLSFGTNSTKVKKYVMHSTHILRALYNYVLINSTFTLDDLARQLNFSSRSIQYQIDSNLKPLGILEIYSTHSNLERGRYHEFGLTQLGVDFLNHIFS